MRRAGLAALLVGVAVVTTVGAKPLPGTPYLTTEKSIQLPGGPGKGDVVVADPAAHLVYVAQSPNNNVVVIDTRTNSIRTVLRIPQTLGIAYSGRFVYASASTLGKVAVIAKSTWRVVAWVRTGGVTPDALYYDARDGEVFVANDDSNTMSVFRAAPPFTLTARLALRPVHPATGPDLGTYAAATNTIYQSDDNDVLVIDPATKRITRVIPLPLPAGKAAKDEFYDAATGLLWVATNISEVLVINPATGAVVQTVTTSSGADQIAVDHRLRLLFLGESKNGHLGIIKLDGFQEVVDTKLDVNFHTLAQLAGSDLLYTYLGQANRINVDLVRMDVVTLGMVFLVVGGMAAFVLAVFGLFSLFRRTVLLRRVQRLA